MEDSDNLKKLRIAMSCLIDCIKLLDEAKEVDEVQLAQLKEYLKEPAKNGADVLKAEIVSNKLALNRIAMYLRSELDLLEDVVNFVAYEVKDGGFTF